MSLTNVSTAYLNSALLPAVRQTQSQLANLEIESSSGQYADLGLQLGDQSGYELSLRNQDDLLQTLTTANGVTSSTMSSAQSVLSSIVTSAQSTAKSLVAWSSSGNSTANLQGYGQSALQQLIAVANTTVGGGYVFGGQNSGVAPMDDYFSQTTSSAKTALDSAFQSYFGFSTSSSQVANITATQMQGFLSSSTFTSQFSGSNWTSNWSNASSVNTSAEISPGQTVETSTNTNTAGFQQLAQGYAMISEFGNIGLSSSAAGALATVATNVINAGAASITETETQLGSVQSQISQADDSMSTQMTLLQKQLSSFDSVDPQQVATELTTLTTQLQTAYQLTAKINSLNLAQYLPTS